MYRTWMCTVLGSFLSWAPKLGSQLCYRLVAFLPSFRWENHYYRDICSGNLTVKPAAPDHPEPLDTPIVGMRQGELDAEVKVESCKVCGGWWGPLRAVNTGALQGPHLVGCRGL